MGVVIKKGFFNFDRFRFVCKKDFLKEIERFCNHFSQKLKGFFKKSGGFNETLISKRSLSPKTQGFACKSGVVLEFWGVCMRLVKNYRLLDARSLLF
ncbi:hypothetical protein C2R47_01625 [Helicobacter pylori]|nr:hypothetical protein C2R47_01625 [Helicobacter pylori]